MYHPRMGRPTETAASPSSTISPAQLAQLIDHTVLKPEATDGDVLTLCGEARRWRFHAVCVNPANVARAVALLEGSPVAVCSVVGFPLGANAPETKAYEARRAIADGAREIDMVINVGALKSGNEAAVRNDIASVVEVCAAQGALCKVIIETSLLADPEKVRACELAMDAGAGFVKTSTGFSTGGATTADVALMARTVAPRGLGVKASGGIRSYQDVARMVEAGATRVGCSASVRIMEEATAFSGSGRPS